MGTKQNGKRKYLFLHLACLGCLVLTIFGCLHFSKKKQGQQLLDQGMEQLAERQYDASEAKSVAVLNDYPDSLSDQALFQIGLLYVHPGNPKRNYAKSLASFDKISKDFSESRFRHQAQIWALVVRDVIAKEQDIRLLNKKKSALQTTVDQQKIEISNLKKKMEARENDDLIASLEKTVVEQKKEITQLLDQIEKLKRVDLRIEEKKQKILQQNENIKETSNGKNSGS